MKKFLSTFLLFVFGLSIHAQTAADYDARLNPIQSYQRNNPAYLNQPAQSESQTVEIARSDMGIQRPIEAKKQDLAIIWDFLPVCIIPIIP